MPHFKSMRFPNSNEHQSQDFETTYYRYCRDQSGRLVSIDVARENGRLVPRFPRQITEPSFVSSETDSEEFVELVEEVSQGLNELERRRWLLATVNEQSISEIARTEKVSRTAIIDSFRRMARRNDYVAIWLKNKKRRNQYE
jgi:DNA-directed RNA polymerase specialized sigma24 family protein